jgi:hypothetical protein
MVYRIKPLEGELFLTYRRIYVTSAMATRNADTDMAVKLHLHPRK